MLPVWLVNTDDLLAYFIATDTSLHFVVLVANVMCNVFQQDRGVGVGDLCINTEEAMTNVKNLYAELSSLRKHLEKV